jgi:O-antigen ligase
MGEFKKKLNANPIVSGIKYALSSEYYPFVTAPIVLFCYYMGLDMLLIYYFAFSIMLMVLLLDDLSPLVTNFLFLNIIISKQNSPSTTAAASDYFFQTANVAQIIALISIDVIAIFFRIILSVKQKKFKLNFTFLSLAAFSFILLFNGVLAEGYTAMNLVYGIFMAFFFVGIYSVMQCGAKVDEKSFKNVCYGFVALSIDLLIELVIAYFTTEGLFVNGEINRYVLMFGWGVYNTMGMLFVISIPPILYLAHSHKYGFIFFAYSILVFIACFVCTSRQAMIGALIIYPVSLIVLCKGGKWRKTNICIAIAAVIICAVLYAVFKTKIKEFFEIVYSNFFMDGELNGSGRWKLWKSGIAQFKQTPIFGAGFYVDIPTLDVGTVGLSIIPLMFHNTFVQLLATCGIISLVAYVVHRVATVISFFKNVTYMRTFIALTIVALLIVNLFDNHLFYIFPTMIYSSVLALLINSERVKK